MPDTEVVSDGPPKPVGNTSIVKYNQFSLILAVSLNPRFVNDRLTTQLKSELTLLVELVQVMTNPPSRVGFEDGDGEGSDVGFEDGIEDGRDDEGSDEGFEVGITVG